MLLLTLCNCFSVARVNFTLRSNVSPHEPRKMTLGSIAATLLIPGLYEVEVEERQTLIY